VLHVAWNHEPVSVAGRTWLHMADYLPGVAAGDHLDDSAPDAPDIGLASVRYLLQHLCVGVGVGGGVGVSPGTKAKDRPLCPCSIAVVAQERTCACARVFVCLCVREGVRAGEEVNDMCQLQYA
jgi:hypothetical protein